MISHGATVSREAGKVVRDHLPLKSSSGRRTKETTGGKIDTRGGGFYLFI